MTTTRPRRIVSRAVMMLAVVVLLFSAYVSSFVAIHLKSGHFRNLAVNHWFYRPLSRYKFSDHVGHVEFRGLCSWCSNRFQGSLWEHCESERMREREGGDIFELRRNRSAASVMRGF